jgi:ketosteroid isomerase-like protein
VFRLGASLALLVLLTTLSSAQRPALPPAMQAMVDTERAFAARALIVGWKQAFLEHFSDEAVGFDNGEVGSARAQFAANPDPPKDLRVVWEPRLGDIASSGEFGFLTGPVRRINPARNNGRPVHSVYTSVWKRERDGVFRVVMDVGVPTPGPATFLAGVTRVALPNRFTGDYDERTPPLAAADQVLNSDLRSSPARAYRDRLAPGARFYRPNQMPIVGERAVLSRQASQRPLASADNRYAEAARSGDVGYTWGDYATRVAARGRAGTGAPAAGRSSSDGERGFYVRVWMRERSGQWKVALDITQPQ